jgi:hypothetical protein
VTAGDDDVSSDAWLRQLVSACDRALERLSPDDHTVADLRADISALRSALHGRLADSRED